jgi:hypothetical protein
MPNEKAFNMRSFTNERGSFTLEASLIFPMILLTTFTLIFLSIYVYEKATLYYTASKAVDRAAYMWINKHAKITVDDEFIESVGVFEKKGALINVPKKELSDLYWRISNDGSATFILNGAEEYSTDSNSLVIQKLTRVANTIPFTQGEIKYSNKFGLSKKVSITLEKQLKLPSVVEYLIRTNNVKVQASANVGESVEFIRNVDLIRNLIGKIKNPGQR